MKIALVHDYLYTYGGAERVLEALHEIWPEAPIYAAWVDWSWLKKQKPEWNSWQIKTSWFDKIPFKNIMCSPLRFLTPKIWSSFNLSNFDIIISSSAWGICKGVSLNRLSTKYQVPSTKNKKLDNEKSSLEIGNWKLEIKAKPLHICYCHTPPRYLYGYPTAKNFEKFWWGRMYARIINPFMRYYDFKSSETIDWFICNSIEVEKRINKFYRREAEVIYPPININSKHKALNSKQIQNTKYKIQNTDYLLMVNRLVEPKNVDLAIKACKKLKINLKIVGSGPDENRLKQIANNSPYIEFLGYVDDQELEKLYLNCKAVLYLASEEDFGITPVEAMSFGKPVIAFRSGGVQESIIEGKTGFYIDKLDIKEIVKLLQPKADRPLDENCYMAKLQKINPMDCVNQAKKFSKERFKKEIKGFVAQKWFNCLQTNKI